MKINKKNKKGFTIIEVVLVLAIGGLIIAMALIALPAMQKAQRNTQRKRDLALIVTQMDSYRINNSGKSVTDDASKATKTHGFCYFYKKYIPHDMVDPSTGEPYKVSLWKSEKVINCLTGEKIQRGQDPTAHGRSSSSFWAKMEVGDIQYNDVAICDGEVWIDDLNRSANLHYFAVRMYLEGGATLCMDNGGSKVAIPTETTRPTDPITSFGIIKQ